MHYCDTAKGGYHLVIRKSKANGHTPAEADKHMEYQTREEH